MQDSVDRYCQEDRTIGIYVKGFVAEEARQEVPADLLAAY
jgi:hypothetical protein